MAQNPLRPIVAAWIGAIQRAMDYKKKVFQDDADEAMRFFNGPYDFLYKPQQSGGSRSFAFDDKSSGLTFRMTHNRVAEMVQLFGPVLYHQNPDRQVSPREIPELKIQALGNPNDPYIQQAYFGMAQQIDRDRSVDELRAELLQVYLNYTPRELDLKTHVRSAIDEAVIKGMGCLSGGTELYAQVNGHETLIRVRDVERTQGTVKLWNGSAWTKVTGIRKKPRSGDELKITLRSGEEVNCTRDHGWPTQRGLLRADELVVGDRLRYVKHDDTLAVGGEHLPDEIGWLVGLYIAEGNIAKEKNDVSFHIAGHIEETERHERLERIVRQYGGAIRWRTTIGTKKKDADVSSRVLVSILREYVNGDGAYKKHLTQKCWERSNMFLGELLRGYLAGDGHWIEGEDVWRLGFCRNKALAGDIRTLCARLGLGLTLKLYKQKVKQPALVGAMCLECEETKFIRTYKGAIRTRPPKINNGADLGEIVGISPANWRCDVFYDIEVEDNPHTYALASGLITHNCLWTELYRRPGAKFTMVGSFYDSVDHLAIDPDMETLETAKWIARRMTRPYWEVEREFGFAERSLKRYANLESATHQGMSSGADAQHNDINRRQGLSNDLLVYWKVYSKMGAGHRIQGIGPIHTEIESLRGDLDMFGDNVYLAIAENIPFPLNLPDRALTSLPPDQIFLRAQWPVPFWADGRWPMTPIVFHPVPRQVWPMSHLKPGLGELCFLNWAYSFLAGKVRTISRDFIAVAQHASAELKRGVIEGGDLEVIELESLNKNISEVVQFLQHPNINNSFLQVIGMISDAFDKRVGLSELLYGQQPKQLRTAAAAHGQYQSLRIRPDDMAAKVDQAMTQMTRSEAIAARWFVRDSDVEPIMGPVAAQMWSVLVQQSDVHRVIYELEYSVEAGSARRRWTDESNTMAAINNLGPMLVQLGQATGDYSMIYQLMKDWAKTSGLDAERYVPPARFVPPPPEAQQGQQPDGQADMQRSDQEHQQQMQHRQEDHMAKLAIMIEQARVKNVLAKASATDGNGR